MNEFSVNLSTHLRCESRRKQVATMREGVRSQCSLFTVNQEIRKLHHSRSCVLLLIICRLFKFCTRHRLFNFSDWCLEKSGMHHLREVIFTRRWNVFIKYYKKKHIVFMDELFTIKLGAFSFYADFHSDWGQGITLLQS